MSAISTNAAEKESPGSSVHSVHNVHAPRTTPMGTPCSPAWDAAHGALVEAAEARLGKRICGARTLSGNPCTFDPNHENGRCRFHGGFNLTGAQPGNRNAVVHGLYARAIQRCGEQCPMWQTCPCAGPDIAKLPGPERPPCPYEVTAFNAAVTDLRAQRSTKPKRDPMDDHAVSELAMLRVLLLRAGAALSVKPLVDMTVVTAENYRMTNAKPGAYLQAFLRISSEHRRYTKLHGIEEPENIDDAAILERNRRARYDTSTLPEDLDQLERADTPAEQHATALLHDAEKLAENRSELWAMRQYKRATFLAPTLAAAALNPDSPHYLPEFAKVLPKYASAKATRTDDS